MADFVDSPSALQQSCMFPKQNKTKKILKEKQSIKCVTRQNVKAETVLFEQQQLVAWFCLSREKVSLTPRNGSRLSRNRTSTHCQSVFLFVKEG